VGTWSVALLTNVRTSASVMGHLQAEAGVPLEVLCHPLRAEAELGVEVSLVPHAVDGHALVQHLL
jgi:hypothetical protein